MNRQRGFTIAEITIAMGLLAIAFMGLIGAQLYSSRTAMVNEESTRAMRACEQVVEQMYGSTREFEEIFRRFNTSTVDNATIPVIANPYGTAGQCTFEVLRDGQIVFGPMPAGQQSMFQPQQGFARCGLITLPENAAGALSETAAATMGFTGPQCDLNANGNSGDAVVNGPYTVLPVIVTLRFRGVTGTNRTITFRKVLTRVDDR